VTNEAMASGLAVIAHQLIAVRRSTWSAMIMALHCTSFEVDELVEAMRQLINDRARLEEMKRDVAGKDCRVVG
jgi:glycosyltransferase involved in cell wall biosynthesis